MTTTQVPQQGDIIADEDIYIKRGAHQVITR